MLSVLKKLFDGARITPYEEVVCSLRVFVCDWWLSPASDVPNHLLSITENSADLCRLRLHDQHLFPSDSLEYPDLLLDYMFSLNLGSAADRFNFKMHGVTKTTLGQFGKALAYPQTYFMEIGWRRLLVHQFGPTDILGHVELWMCELSVTKLRIHVNILSKTGLRYNLLNDQVKSHHCMNRIYVLWTWAAAFFFLRL